MRNLFIFGLCAMALGAAACTAETESEEVGQNSDELFVWGMQNPGYSPVEAGAPLQTIAMFNPLQIGENFVLVEEGGDTVAYISTTNFSFEAPFTGELTRVDVATGMVTHIPVVDASGQPVVYGWMSGIDVDTADGGIVFALSFLDQSGTFALGTSIFKYLPAIGQMFEIGGGNGIGVNGLLIHEGKWYGTDTLSPMGSIVRGSTQGGPAEVWLQDPALAPLAGYSPQPYSCDPPVMGGNGLRASGRLLPCLQSFAVTNVTTKKVLEVGINADGTPGAVTTMYNNLSFYPDGIDQGTCGIAKKDTFIADPANDRVAWANPYTQEVVTVIPDCDAVTSVRTQGGYLYAVCAASPLSCGSALPRFVRIKLDTTYERKCNWN